jgi:hypothetical protein
MAGNPTRASLLSGYGGSADSLNCGKKGPIEDTHTFSADEWVSLIRSQIGQRWGMARLSLGGTIIVDTHTLNPIEDTHSSCPSKVDVQDQPSKISLRTSGEWVSMMPPWFPFADKAVQTRQTTGVTQALPCA